VNVRAVWSAVLVGVLAATAAGPSSGLASGGEASHAPRSESVTVRGVLERLAVEGSGTDPIRYAVRGPERTWWLGGLPEPAPAAGSDVEITGIPRGEHTLSVQTIRVLSTSGTTMATAAAPRSTRILVLRVYWGTHPRPPRPRRRLSRR
jgi:hypothetical protein